MRTIAVPSRIIAMSYELAPEVSEYYERGGEVSRLTTTPDGRLEFLRTQDILRRLLGLSPSTILDIGGATGAHAAWLTADGHQVTLVDPVASQVAVASANGIQGQVGDARDLPFGNGLFDAALLLGPLYHLLTEADRLRALEEAIRVVRPGGQVVAAAIGRFAPWLDKASKTRLSNDNDEPMLAEAHRTGRLRPRTYGSSGFTTAYVHRPEQLHNECTTAGLADVTVYAVEGAAWLMDSLGGQLDDPVATTKLLEGLRVIEREPSMLGASAHLLAVGRT